MLLPRRNFLLFSTLLLGASSAFAQQPAPAPQFRLTVWTIRPTVMSLPTAEDLKTDSARWTRLNGFDKADVRMMSDDKLLEVIRKANPRFTIPRLEQKSVVLFSADTLTAATLADKTTFKIKVPVREEALAEIDRTRGKDVGDVFRRTPEDTLFFAEIRIPHNDRAELLVETRIGLSFSEASVVGGAAFSGIRHENERSWNAAPASALSI